MTFSVQKDKVDGSYHEICLNILCRLWSCTRVLIDIW